MRKLKLVFVVMVLLLGSLYFINHTLRARGRMYGMGMGQGMMGTPQRSEENSHVTVSSSHAKALLRYIHDQGLQCLQCHAVTAAGFGPSFSAISVNYTKVENATSILSDHIAHGFGRMPPGLANNEQATHLAELVLDLLKNEEKN